MLVHAFRAVIKRGPPPGLLAFDGDIAVGWCQLTPRDALPSLDRQWRLKRIDDVPVWSLSCFYIRIGYRRQGCPPRERARTRGLPARRQADAERVMRYDLSRSRPARRDAARGRTSG
jgi:hypothetical protein